MKSALCDDCFLVYHCYGNKVDRFIGATHGVSLPDLPPGIDNLLNEAGGSGGGGGASSALKNS